MRRVPKVILRKTPPAERLNQRVQIACWVAGGLIALVLVIGALRQDSGNNATPVKETASAAETPAPVRAEKPSRPFDTARIFEDASRAVVRISVFDVFGRKTATGSGFFISEDGLLVTNFHVVEGAHTATVKTINGDVYNVAGAIALHKDYDIAVLSTGGRNHSFLELSDATRVAPGTRIAVIGNPLGFEFSITEGIVSGTRTDEDEHEMLQITAAISPGSSGGPVIDASGKVVAVVRSHFIRGQMLNFAVPADVPLWLWRKSGSTLMPLTLAR